MPKHLTLHVNDDIEFMTPLEFDKPSPDEIERAQVVASTLDKWIDSYEAKMQARRERWANEPWHTLGAYDG